MSVIVDTPVWSQCFRWRRAGSPSVHAEELRRLIREGHAVLLGPVRQEILSGIRLRQDFLSLRDVLRGFPDVPLGPEVYEVAAESFNACRAKGIQGSNTDFLLCAASISSGFPVYTTDRDFPRYADVLKFDLYAPGASR